MLVSFVPLLPQRPLKCLESMDVYFCHIEVALKSQMLKILWDESSFKIKQTSTNGRKVASNTSHTNLIKATVSVGSVLYFSGV